MAVGYGFVVELLGALGGDLWVVAGIEWGFGPLLLGYKFFGDGSTSCYESSGKGDFSCSFEEVISS